MEDEATMQSNGAMEQLNEELSNILSTFVCGGSISYRQLPVVQYKAKSVPMWSLLQEYGWKKVAQKKGADWTFVHQKFNENCSSVYQMVSITKKQLGLGAVVLPKRSVATVFAMQGNTTTTLRINTELPYEDPDEFVYSGFQYRSVVELGVIEPGLMLSQDYILLMWKLITRDCTKCANKVFCSRTATEYLERSPANFRRDGMERLTAWRNKKRYALDGVDGCKSVVHTLRSGKHWYVIEIITPPPTTSSSSSSS